MAANYSLIYSPESWKEVGNSKITYSYEESGVEIKLPNYEFPTEVVRKLKGLTVKGDWSNIQYTNTDIDISGLIFEAYYNDETTSIIEPDKISKDKSSWSGTEGNQSITFFYTENGIPPKSASKSATVHRKLIRLDVGGDWSNIQRPNTSVDTTGLEFTAYYNDGTSSVVTPSSISPMVWAGPTNPSQVCTFTYTENGISKEISETVNMTYYLTTSSSNEEYGKVLHLLDTMTYTYPNSANFFIEAKPEVDCNFERYNITTPGGGYVSLGVGSYTIEVNANSYGDINLDAIFYKLVSLDNVSMRSSVLRSISGSVYTDKACSTLATTGVKYNNQTFYYKKYYNSTPKPNVEVIYDIGDNEWESNLPTFSDLVNYYYEGILTALLGTEGQCWSGDKNGGAVSGWCVMINLSDGNYMMTNDAYTPRHRCAKDSLSTISTTLNDNSWATIFNVTEAGLASQYWKVGDYKNVNIAAGTVDRMNVPAGTYRAVIIGINHNSSIEKSNTIDFCIGQNTSGTDICFYNDMGVRINDTNTTEGGWTGSQMYLTYLPQFYQLLLSGTPSIKSAIVTPIKYTHNATGGQDNNTEANVTKSEKSAYQLFLMSEYEIFGVRTRANSYEQNKQAQYAYYSSSGLARSKVRYRTDTGSAYHWWERSAMCMVDLDNYFCEVLSSGEDYSVDADHSLGLVPCFRI